MVAVGSSILASDYNSMRTTISSVLNSQYNETLLSSAVSGGTGNPLTSNSVESSQILNLFLDIQRAYVHQQGSINATIAVAATPAPAKNHAAAHPVRFNVNKTRTIPTTKLLNLCNI